jgi:hypothetical protein
MGAGEAGGLRAEVHVTWCEASPNSSTDG